MTEAELALAVGLLDPVHQRTHDVTEQISNAIERRPIGRLLQTARYGEKLGFCPVFSRVCKDMFGTIGALSDALLFATARKHGCRVLTRNVVGFDLLAQLDPTGSVLFYRTKSLGPLI